MTVLLHPTYFPNVAAFSALLQAEKVLFEMHDNYVKQTYRNRCYIYGANGKLSLNIPVVFSQKYRQKYKDVQIFNDENWQAQHWKSLLSAYRTSPFFEYYEDDLRPLFEKKASFLLDFNLRCFEVICDCLQIEFQPEETKDFDTKPKPSVADLRHFVNAKKEIPLEFEPYTQVFQDKHGFLSNLSILDVLCNEGPNTVNYLTSQTLKPL
ncbi:WbqC family protein [Gaetbulibacter sp. M240]|uniref:WbqC family protein n=1 Tax=Gaetbulibacter sp. M240 TaxID=3126511 RepID=UPI00374E3F12